jgi:hypothetical protein
MEFNAQDDVLADLLGPFGDPICESSIVSVKFGAMTLGLYLAPLENKSRLYLIVTAGVNDTCSDLFCR